MAEVLTHYKEIMAFVGGNDRCSAGANLDHLMHFFVGYRDTMLGVTDGNPYGPGSARAFSWDQGMQSALKDQKEK